MNGLNTNSTTRSPPPPPATLWFLATIVKHTWLALGVYYFRSRSAFTPIALLVLGGFQPPSPTISSSTPLLRAQRPKTLTPSYPFPPNRVMGSLNRSYCCFVPANSSLSSRHPFISAKH